MLEVSIIGKRSVQISGEGEPRHFRRTSRGRNLGQIQSRPLRPVDGGRGAARVTLVSR